jgi:hypothetical protein
MKPFLSFQGSRACFFSALFTSRFKEAGLRIPLDRPFDLTQGHELEVEWLRAAVSPIPKPRKEQCPPASLSRNDFMVSPIRRIHGNKDIHISWDSLVTELRQ